MIKSLRIDDRLMHAQVTFGWAQTFNIKGILIVSDRVAGNPISAMAAKLAKPDYCKLWIKNLEEGIAAIPKLNSFDYTTMVIVENVADALEIMKRTDCIHYVNMGGQRAGADRFPILETMYISQQDLQMLKEIENMGAEVEIRTLVTNNGHKVDEFLK